ncbi:MAG: DEAD/DEAH box helicase [Hyphomicrobiaceae bacterium]
MEPTKTFADLDLSQKVLAAIESAGYTSPTPIQEAAIPVAVSGRDIMGIAQTGTGKTASFVLPMITRLEKGRARARMPRSLILAPTRELAAQVAQSFEKYGVNHKLSLALLIGGVSFDEQFKKLDRGVDVLIATPGRLLDHFQRGKLMLMGVEILVIDEADRMLDMGFIPDIEKICKLLPPRRQTLFFSATMAKEITRLADSFLKNPERVEVAPPATTAKTITQTFKFCPDGEDWAKREILRELITGAGDQLTNAIVFANRKRDVAILLKSLSKHGFNAGALHGDMDQKARMETLAKFRDGEITILAASDVAARGLDIPDVSHVFNYDMPWQTDDYVHRIGRTGRAGRSGSTAALITIDDLKIVKEIEQMNGETLVWDGEPPTEDDYADAGKKRGRGGRGGRSSSSRSGNSRRSSSRPTSSESRSGKAPSRGGRGRGRSSGNAQNGEIADTAAKTETLKVVVDKVEVDQDPGSMPQPDISHGPDETANTPVPASVDQAQSTDGGEKPRRPRRSRGGRRHNKNRNNVDATSETTSGEKPSTDEKTTETRAPRRRAVSQSKSRSENTPRDQKQANRNEKKGPGTRAGGKGGRRQAGVGFEDNIPEFLRRPVRRPKATVDE